ncbi:MAG TPA: VWA domain-containing protein [Spirochaetota bacterium]|nr:VWA domain-containing protein [Spirochaetota bacterium]HQP47225.1 VWA domain-containing protein [Spirochaetota bacterium]
MNTRNERDDHHRVKRKFFDFINVLQDAGIRVSTVEVLDMFDALRYVDFSDRASFKQILSTTLVKDYTDLPVFEKCFIEFFEKRINEKGFDPDIFLQDTLALESLKDRYGLSDSDIEALEKAIDLIIDEISEDHGDLSLRDMAKLILENPVLSSSSGAIGNLIFNTRSKFALPGGGQNEPDAANEEEDMEFLQAMIGQRIRRRVLEKNTGKKIFRRDEYLLSKPIYQITQAEMGEMRELIKRLGQKLKNRISLRKKLVKHGHIDIKKTLRKNLQYGGTPFRIFFKDRRIDRPQLVVLCDISSSVSQYSRFMLLLTYTLQSLFSKVRTFAFISNMVEITPLFMEMNPERALNSIFSDTDFTYGWGSNYGNSFNQFLQEYSDSLTGKTTVLVLGDARNNSNDPGLDSFVRIKEKSRNLFWLNPDRRHLWDWSDSIATLYMPYCREMREVKNFHDLSDFIDKLFISSR